MSESKRDEDAIYRVETVPPPAGEDDAYSAPTRQTEMPPDVLEKMRRHNEAAAVASKLAALAAKSAATAEAPAEAKLVKSERPPSGPVPAPKTAAPAAVALAAAKPSTPVPAVAAVAVSSIASPARDVRTRSVLVALLVVSLAVLLGLFLGKLT